MATQEFSLKRELQRKAVHVTSVLIVIFYYFMPKEAIMLPLTLFLILFLEVEFIRLDLRLNYPSFTTLQREREG
uniref:Uncharacterized protein n=1 Tax=Candidatus Methanophagaceae archaeon ANME-1 ERB6 TaxID=2759912 RepID=A0A7G9YZZ6_9EURY|nr:hypothetical protein BBDCAPAO_00017 [Methanosarcinales archaeon ANME-1 ERB6]